MEKIIIASGPVIVKDNKVLLDISGEDNFWKFCGGRRKEDEDLVATAKNRAKEELNIDIHKNRAKEELNIDIHILNPEPFVIARKKPDEEDKEVILVHYLADYSGKISAGPEVREWQWFDVNSLPENIAPNIVPALKYFNFIK